MMDQQGSVLSHLFSVNPITPTYQDDRKLIKDWQPYVPLLDGKDAITPPNFISLPRDFQRSPSFDCRYKDLSIGESLKKNEMVSMLLSSELTELDLDLRSNPNWFPNLLLHQNSQNTSHQPFVGHGSELLQSSKVIFLNDDKVLLGENTIELEEYMGMLTEMYRFKSFEVGKTKAYLVPSFYRIKEEDDAKENVAAPQIVPFPLSPGKMKSNKQIRKKGKRSLNGERDGYKRSYFHACESLLTLMMGANERHNKGSVMSVVRSAPEIPALLTQMSACIAGTGLAVLFSSVAWIVNSSFVGISASKCVSIGLGLGLMWVAWGVINLRDAIASIGKNSCYEGADVATILKDIYFRVLVLMSLAVMKLG